MTMPEHGLREATAKDRDAVIALWTRCDLTRPWNPPEGDFDQALANPSSTILVLEGPDGALLGSVMAGFDGHRGWVYYVAVDPDHRKSGLGRRLMAGAEDWLRARGCRKLELLVRGTNRAVQAFYFTQGYTVEDRAILAKWLEPPPVRPPDLFDRPLPATITWLEMTTPPAGPARPTPQMELPLAVMRLHQPQPAYYRFLQQQIGENWMWWMRRAMPEEVLLTHIHDPQVEIFQLLLGGSPAGFVELDYRPAPQEAGLAYFGLMPWAIGRGLGGWFLDWAIRAMWAHPSAPQKLLVNTCTHDHPAALALYQKMGFEPVRRSTELWPDPRGRGLIPPHVQAMGGEAS